MIRVIIVDDEELARDEMRFLLKEQEIELVGEASNGAEAIELVEREKPDLMFLDIQMPEMNGFQVLNKLLEAGDVPLIIFATAYDQYAIKALEHNAFDYLLKPIDKERLSGALARVRKSLPRRDEYTERLRKLAESINVKTPFLPRIVIQKENDVGLIEVEKVAMMSREGGSIKAYTSE